LRALALEPSLVAAVNNLGTLAFVQGNYQAALKWFNGALLREPQSSSAHFNRGCALKAMGKTDDAIADFTWAWEHDGFADAGNELGLIDMQTNPMRAAAIFQAVLQKSPNYLNAYYNMGLALQKGGDKANARRAFEAYYNMTPDPKDKAEAKARLNQLPR
jgi:lipoprotein NlpI